MARFNLFCETKDVVFSQVTVAHTDLTEQQAVNNVLAAAQRLAALIPAGPGNVRVMHLRTEHSPALTIYAALGKETSRVFVFCPQHTNENPATWEA